MSPRVLCLDGSCTGVINEQACCGTCGRTLADLQHAYADVHPSATFLNPMRGSGRCSACGGDRIYRVAPVRERAGSTSVVVSLHVVDETLVLGGRGTSDVERATDPLVMYLCIGCGRVEWFVEPSGAGREMSRESTAEHPVPCSACQRQDVRVVAVADARSSSDPDVPLSVLVKRVRLQSFHRRQGAPRNEFAVGAPVRQPGTTTHFEVELAVGHFLVHLCSSCGFVEWRAGDLDDLRRQLPAAASARSGGICQRCDGGNRWQIVGCERSSGDTVVERAVVLRTSALLGRAEPLGKLRAMLCARCGHTDWFGVHLDELGEDAATGVTVWQAPPGTHRTGPFR